MYSKHRSHGDTDRASTLDQNINNFLKGRKGPKKTDVIVGIPFHDEVDTLPKVIKTALKGLHDLGLSRNSVVLCVGVKNRQSELIDAVSSIVSSKGLAVETLLLSRDLHGRGWASQAIIRIAAHLQSPVILLTPDLSAQADEGDVPGLGFAPHWIDRLHRAVTTGGQDLALARFSRHYLAHPVESLLVFPIMTGVFGMRLRQAIPGVSALSTTMVRTVVDAKSPLSDAGQYGFYPWLTVLALQEGRDISEVPLGLASFRYGIGKLKLIFRETAHILLKRVADTTQQWLRMPEAVLQPHVFGQNMDRLPPSPEVQTREIVKRFKSEFNHFDDTMFRELIPPELRRRMQHLADDEMEGAAITAEDWVGILHNFLELFRFERGFHADDIVDGLFPFFLARLMSILGEEHLLTESIVKPLREDTRIRRMIGRELEAVLETHAELMVGSRKDFIHSWVTRETEAQSYLPRLGQWEFIPHVGVMVPQILERRDKSIVPAGEVYQELIDKYRQEFTFFLSEHLELDTVSPSSDILEGIGHFMAEVESALNDTLLPFDLSTVEGTSRTAETILHSFAPRDVFQLKEEVATDLLLRVQPRDLLMHCKCGTAADLLTKMSGREALGIAAWTDQQGFLDSILDIIEKEAEPDWFHMGPLTLRSVDLNEILNPLEMRGTAAIGRLSGQLVVANNLRGRAGDYPKLWFFLKVIKRIIGIELFSEIWRQFASEGVDFSRRLAVSIRGHWGRRILSAHNLFENHHQRILVERLHHYANSLSAEDEDMERAALLIRAAASVYHLAITLPDSTFVPLSAWTWASYSFRGGVGAPTPLSSLVERDWATRDFLTAYLERSGHGDATAVDKAIYGLIREGKESEDLAHHFFGMEPDVEELTAPPVQTQASIPARKMTRPVSGPILEPIADHSWESKYVLNAAAVRLGGNIHILYRAFGEDKISRIGLAWTKDGIHIDGRLPHPIFEPADPVESWGCEDPRVTVIGDDLYMLYTAYDGKLAQIAMASIPISAFLEQRFEKWTRHGLGFPGLANKDAVLYPETFDGRWAVYHRIDPNMWLSYIDDLACPWPRTGQKIVTGPRPGMMWDSVKIGAGAQPIKTKYGWLNIYHGVDYAHRYCLGVLFMDLKDPAKVLYQSPNAILEPEVDFEIGKKDGGDYWVPHVVFTCGAVPAEDKEVLDVDDRVFVYYGAADTAVGVAEARLGDIVPIIDTLKPSS